MNKLLLLLMVYVFSIQSAATTTTSTLSKRVPRSSQRLDFDYKKATFKDLCCSQIAKTLRSEIEADVVQDKKGASLIGLKRLPHELIELVLTHVFVQEYTCDQPEISEWNKDARYIAVPCMQAEIAKTIGIGSKEAILQRVLEICETEQIINENSDNSFYVAVRKAIRKLAENHIINRKPREMCKRLKEHWCRFMHLPISVSSLACNSGCLTALQLAPLYNQLGEFSVALLLRRAVRNGHYELIEHLPIDGLTQEEEETFRTAINENNFQKIAEIVSGCPYKSDMYEYIFSYAAQTGNEAVVEWVLRKGKYKIVSDRNLNIYTLIMPYICLRRMPNIKNHFDFNEILFYILDEIRIRVRAFHLPDQEHKNLKESLKELPLPTEPITSFSSYTKLELLVLVARDLVRNSGPYLQVRYKDSKGFKKTVLGKIKTSRILNDIFRKDVAIHTERMRNRVPPS